MPTALEFGRARSDIDVISRAGLPLDDFWDEAMDALGRVVPASGGCMATIDPATTMVSGTRKFGNIVGQNERDLEWVRIEYGADDPTALSAMVSTGVAVVGLQRELEGDLDRSVRMAQFMVPHYEFYDEARVVFTDRGRAWGGLSMCRDRLADPFSDEELDFLVTVAPLFARGIRTGLLAQLSRREPAPDRGPAVVIVDAADRIVQSSPGATARLERLGDVRHGGDPLALVQALVSAARRFARGERERMPRVRVRTAQGVWLVAHASPLGGSADRAGDVVVTIEEARPTEVIGLVADAFGLTARERDVTALVLRGADTREIAAAIHVSPYTVQDHLKSIFEKANVTSRGELVARVYFDQYLPRSGDELSPSGWFMD